MFETKVVTYARAIDERQNALARAQMVESMTGQAEVPAPVGQIEIVRQTTIQEMRSNGTRFPNATPSVRIEVLATLSLSEAAHLGDMITRSIIDALDTRL